MAACRRKPEGRERNWLDEEHDASEDESDEAHDSSDDSICEEPSMWDHDADLSDDDEADMYFTTFEEPAADDGDDMGAFK